MTRSEQARLVELLAKHLNGLHHRGADRLVTAAGELLYGLGVTIHFHDDTFFVVSSKP